MSYEYSDKESSININDVSLTIKLLKVKSSPLKNIKKITLHVKLSEGRNYFEKLLFVELISRA
jgi:hypothetical protein